MAYHVPIVDLSAFFSAASSLPAQEQAVLALKEACHEFGFCTVTGHGVTPDLIDRAFEWTEKLFGLPMADKMKAAHPPSNIPHRGYSPPGLEKVYARALLHGDEVVSTNGLSLDQVKDFKESFEIGHEHNPPQTNIWLPEDVLPGFKDFMTLFYAELDKTCRVILHVFALALELSPKEKHLLESWHDGRNNQLRLLHYPPLPKSSVEAGHVARMPAHEDWSTFTIVFQDSTGGLELVPRCAPGTFIPATPVPYGAVLNVADMLQRLSNDYFVSATHRVALPPLVNIEARLENHDESGIMTKARYSIPYFFAPRGDAIVSVLNGGLNTDMEPRYGPVMFEEYAGSTGRYAYERGLASSMELEHV